MRVSELASLAKLGRLAFPAPMIPRPSLEGLDYSQGLPTPDGAGGLDQIPEDILLQTPTSQKFFGDLGH